MIDHLKTYLFALLDIAEPAASVDFGYCLVPKWYNISIHILYNSFSCIVGWFLVPLFGFFLLFKQWLNDRFALSRFANSDGRVVRLACCQSSCLKGALALGGPETPTLPRWLSFCRCPGAKRSTIGPLQGPTPVEPLCGYVAGKWLLPFDKFL